MIDPRSGSTVVPPPPPKPKPAPPRVSATRKDWSVPDWRRYAGEYRRYAETELARKRASRFPGPLVQQAVRKGGSPVHVGHWSTAPGREYVPVFFQDFDKTTYKVQLYTYPRVEGPLAEDPQKRDALLRSATWVSFDVSGRIASAYDDGAYMKGNRGTASVLGLPESGREILTPTRDWPDKWLVQDPGIAAAMRQGTVTFQIFEQGLLVETPDGRVQAFRKEPLERMGSAWPGGTIDGTPAPPPTMGSGLVGVSGGHLSVDGEPFRHNGANLSQLLYEPPDRIWDELVHLKDNGIKDARVFLPNNLLTPEEIGDKLQFVLDKANDLGLKVTVALDHFAKQPIWARGDGGQWMEPPYGRGARICVPGDEGYMTTDDGGGRLVHDHSWFAGGYRDNFKPFAEYIVSRFKDHPGVLAWEIANETKDVAAPDDGKAMKAFYKDMAETIRANDPNHLVTAGLTNTREYYCDTAAERREFLANFDFVSIHQYDDAFRADIANDLAAARALGKPVVIGEVGYDEATHTMDAYREYYRRAYDDWGVDSVMVWGASPFSDSGSGDRDNGPLQYPYGMSDYYALMRDTNAALERWNAAH